MNGALVKLLETYLQARGWLPPGVDVWDALKRFRDWWGVTPGEELKVLEAPRFCALHDRLEANAELSKWPTNELKVCFRGQFPGLPADFVQDTYNQAAQAWVKVSGLTIELVADPSRANVVADVGPYDGPGRVLAWSELPGGTMRQLKQLYDQSENWRNLFLLTAMHELGHALGLGHDTPQSGSLMAPQLNLDIDGPQARDIAEIQARYGKPPPPPPPPVPGPGGMPLVVLSREVQNALRSAFEGAGWEMMPPPEGPTE